jgi:hypothetical protein
MVIARDMNQPPFTELPFEYQMSIRSKFGNEILNFEQYLLELDKLINQQKESGVTDFPIHRPSRQKKPFSDQIIDFIQSVTRTCARTMADWPHEYIVRSMWMRVISGIG